MVAGPADTDGMDAPRPESEAGFGLIELVISMVIMQVALLGLLAAFGTSAAALGRSGSLTTAAVLADAQMEMYRAMPYDAIGLDTAGAPTTGMYVADTGVCPGGVCSNSGPKNNGTPNNVFASPWSCTAASGSTSVSTFFSANGANPCLAHRPVSSASTPASPDGKSYWVDTYIVWAPNAGAAGRYTKVVSIIVRNSTGATELAKIQGSFDCSTSQPTASLGAPC